MQKMKYESPNALFGNGPSPTHPIVKDRLKSINTFFCVDGGVYLVKLLSYQAHTGLIHTLGCRGQATRPRQALCVHAVERHTTLTRRHTTLPHDSLADYSTRHFRQFWAPIRQRDSSARPPRHPPWQLFIAPAAAPPGTWQQ